MNHFISGILRAFAMIAAVSLLAMPAALRAEDSDVPYWASMSKDKANVRVGPGLDYRINWVYQRRGLPVKVVRTMDGWRLIEDPDGAKGWLLSRFLSRARYAIVRGEIAEIREKSDGTGRLLWRAEPGVVGQLGDCKAGWCQFDVGGRKGWVNRARLWGAGEP